MEWHGGVVKETEAPNLQDEIQAYYKIKMGVKEQPNLFIMRMKKAKKNLAKHGHAIADHASRDDIVERLPKGAASVSPYTVTHQLILPVQAVLRAEIAVAPGALAEDEDMIDDKDPSSFFVTSSSTSLAPS